VVERVGGQRWFRRRLLDTVLARFETELSAASAVRHPSVVRALATGVDERGRFLLMPFVPGASLREVLVAEGALPEPLVRRIGHALGAGLAALHWASRRVGERWGAIQQELASKAAA